MSPINLEEAKRLAWRYTDLRRSGKTPWTLITRAFDKLFVYGMYPIHKIRLRNRFHEYRDRKVPFFVHHYNATWRNERCLEIALALDFLRRTQPSSWLELGNVLRYYTVETHDVIDKYEKGDLIINEDFVGFQPRCRYDVFISISTFEHIGWDEPKRDPDKVLAALKNI